MVIFLIVVLLFLVPAIAAVLGWTADSRDARYDLGRLDDRWGGAA